MNKTKAFIYLLLCLSGRAVMWDFSAHSLNPVALILGNSACVRFVHDVKTQILLMGPL